MTASRRATARRLTCALLAGLLAACAPRSAAPRPTSPAPATYSPTVTRLLTLVNEERAKGAVCGALRMPPAAPLTLDARLVRAAQLHSEDQATHNYMGHPGSDGSSVGARVTAAGYPWSVVAENVAWNQPTPEVVVAAWMASPGHCENMLRREVSELGAGEENLFWTLVFAEPL